jgi:hypothetical protein
MNSKHLELYSIVGEYNNAGFPLSYCLLSTAAAVDIHKYTKALTAWANCLHVTYGINPVFTHVNKDMVEIGMVQCLWKLEIQLCWWHMHKAMCKQLLKGKLTTTPYNAHHAWSEFPFVSLDFIPAGTPDTTEYEGGTLDETHEEQLP